MRDARRLHLYPAISSQTRPRADGVDLCEVRHEEEVALVGPRTTGPQKEVDVGFGLCGRT